MSSSSSSSSGIGFTGLKLTGYINWPWIWVLSPIWISILLTLTVLAIIFIIALVAGLLK